MSRPARLLSLPKLTALGFAAAASVAAAPSVADAGRPFEMFAGEWNGSGQIVDSKGARERIRCRADFTEAHEGAALNQSIVCASSSYKIDISSYAEASGGSVKGTWSESTRGFTGQLTGRVGNGRFEGVVIGPGFSASVSLTSNGRRQAVTIQPQGGEIADVRIELERGG